MGDRQLAPILNFVDALLGDDIPADRLDVKFGAADLSEAERPMLDAIARYRNGVFFDLRRIGAEAPETIVDEHLARRLSTAASADGSKIEISQTDKSTTVMINGAVPTGSTGLTTIAGGLIVPFLRTVRSHELAVIVYEQEVLDQEQALMLWDLYAEHLGPTPLESLRRLVLIAESPRPNYDLHLRGPGQSANVLLFGNQLTRRRTWLETVNLARGMLAEECVVFFLGAGFSASSRPMPLGDELRDHAIRTIVGEINGRPDFAAYKSRLRDLGLLAEADRETPLDKWVEQLTFERVMKWQLPGSGNDPMRLPAMEEFAEKHEQALVSLGTAVIVMHRLLRAELANRYRRRIVPVTINFDELLETDTDIQFDVFASDEDFENAIAAIDAWLDGSTDRIPYLKLHGTISNPSSLVISTTQTGLKLNEAKRRVLKHLEEKAARWVYVGASMRDRDLYTTFADFVETDEDWVAPSAMPTVHAFCEAYRVDRWARRNERSMAERMHSLTADAFMRAIGEADGLT